MVEKMKHNLPITVLICQFGGPTTRAEVRSFLINLFSDRAILNYPQPFRWILARIIVFFRLKKSCEQYASIGFSPINRSTLAQAQALEKLLKERVHPESGVLVVNRYTPPFAQNAVQALPTQQTSIVVLPLYPQTSRATTESSIKDLVQAADRLQVSSSQWKIIRSWWDNELYARYLVKSIIRDVTLGNSSMEFQKSLTILFSAHGLPLKSDREGDPYRQQIENHSNLLKSRLQQDSSFQAIVRRHKDVAFGLVYQSRVGPVEWLKPYADEEIERLGPQRRGHLFLIPLSFVSDHIETLYEMDITYRDIALQSGFESYGRMRMPNEDLRLTECLLDIVLSQKFN